MHRGLALLVGLALVAGGETARAATAVVKTSSQLRAAIERFERTGGIVVLRPGHYPRIDVGPRSTRTLTLVAHGASARLLRIGRSRDVRVVGLTVESASSLASAVIVNYSKRVVVDRMTVRGTARAPGRLSLTGSSDVVIRRSRFSGCKPGAPCIHLGRANRIDILNSTFADCQECDFIRGGVGAGLLIRDNRFGNALSGSCRLVPGQSCNHQDQIQLVAGQDVVISRNRFGINEFGAAQLYLSGPMQNVLVRNNVFRGSHPARPGYVAPVGITVGNRIEPVHPPLGVVIAHNTILSGSPHTRGSDSSIALSPLYAAHPPDDRPILVNNVLAAVRTPEWVCDQAGASLHNVIREGEACSETDLLADPLLDPVWGVPGPDSPTIDRGQPGWAVGDVNRVRRDPLPDVGAYEYIGT